jgi:hypothetical protein
MKFAKKLILLVMIAVLAGLANLACEDKVEVSRKKQTSVAGPDEMVVEGDPTP